MYRPEWDLPSLRVEFDLEQFSGHLEGNFYFIFHHAKVILHCVSLLIIRKLVR